MVDLLLSWTDPTGNDVNRVAVVDAIKDTVVFTADDATSPVTIPNLVQGRVYLGSVTILNIAEECADPTYARQEIPITDTGFLGICRAIAAEIERVAGIVLGEGAIIEFLPSVTSVAAFVSTFGNSQATAINAWVCTREGVDEEEQQSGFRFRTIHRMVVRGYFGLKNKDETEKTFQTLIDRVRAAVRGSLSIWPEHPESPSMAVQTPAIGHEMFGSFLVHTCEMRFDVEEFSVIAN